MTPATPSTMAAGWASQPAAPPPSTRRLVTPAARELLRSHDVRLDLSPGLPAVRLSDALTLVRAATSESAGQGWVAVDTLVLSGQDAMDRLARVTAGAVTAMRGITDQHIRVAVRFGVHGAPELPFTTVVLEDAGRLSTSGIQRRLEAREHVVDRADDVDLDIVDGSAMGVTRLLTASGRPVVTIGAPVRRVVASVHNGDEVMAVRPLLEVWANGGEPLDIAETAHLAGSAARAIGERDPS
ncbi:hypothetical protein OHT59_46095 [Streptomyces sp. NBC_00243]|uniref:hypothetical protein n=1 Tax=Streptomyces sp. NBC_00243 TaxID=2975688 RepID=UPI002DDC075D|nr:hypothetical protein [Streptomyces sp. NBC_00243]WRZ25385.1 hypothetical protein OHT59_46095 [Streptomyces sp. NBC_00243]